TFTANTHAGSFGVTASTIGVNGTGAFSLTNSPGSPTHIAVAAGASQTATVGTAFVVPLQALVTDPYGNPVSGVSVLFAAPTTGVSGSFSGTSPSATV